MRFDHSLDNYVGKKEDLRFMVQTDAEDFATAQYLAFCQPHVVLERTDGLFMVLPVPTGQVWLDTGHPVDRNVKQVFLINSMPGEG